MNICCLILSRLRQRRSPQPAFLRGVMRSPQPPLSRVMRTLITYGGVLVALCNTESVLPQVVPDTTLPVNTTVTTSGNTNLISGGTQAGTNLFHSFDSFSLPTGGTAAFNNAVEIQNIFSRITGGSISNIDGLIQANGAANLFLLNPKGIIFGQNARLDIGGSFVGTTASSIKFADGTEFSATAPQNTPLLTVSVPVGLQFGQNPGSIGVQGRGYSLSVREPIFLPIARDSSSSSLQLQSGKTLALVGGDMNLEGGALTAKQGRIELGSVSDGQVSLSSVPQGFDLGYQGVNRLGDIRLSQQALIDASGGGSIQVQGNNVSLTDGSIMLIQNKEEQQEGRIDINTAQSLSISGTNLDARFPGGLRSETEGVGNGADIAISAKQLTVQGGAAIMTRSFNSGKAGELKG